MAVLGSFCAIVFLIFATTNFKLIHKQTYRNFYQLRKNKVVGHIYNPPPPPLPPPPPQPPTPTITEIKIFTYVVILTAVKEKYATILTLTTLPKVLTSLLLQ